jgi:enterochelin esterase-like enzyme
MSVGTMEIPDQRETNRRLRDVLAGRGYTLDYREFNGNHSYLNWRTDLAGRLEALMRRTREPVNP